MPEGNSEPSARIPGTPLGKQDDDSPEAESEEGDFWTIGVDNIFRHHVSSRTTLYVPKEKDFPIPLKYIDVIRRTNTDLESASENFVSDYWTTEGAREMSAPWR